MPFPIPDNVPHTDEASKLAIVVRKHRPARFAK